MSDTTYIKNYDIGTATLDLPYFFYKHRIDFLTFGDDVLKIPVGIACHTRSCLDESDTRFYGKNLFGIVPGMKLTVQKKIVFPEEGSSLKPALVEADGSITEFYGSYPDYIAADRSGRRLHIAATDGSMTISAQDQTVEYYNTNGDITSIKHFSDKTSSSTIAYYSYDNKKRLCIFSGRINMTNVCLSYDAQDRITVIDVQSDIMMGTVWKVTVSYLGNSVVFTLQNGVQYHYTFQNGALTLGSLRTDEYETIGIEVLTCSQTKEEIHIKKTVGSRTAEDTTVKHLHPASNTTYKGFLFEAKDRYGVRTRYQFRKNDLEYTYEVVGDETSDENMFYHNPTTGIQTFRTNVGLSSVGGVSGTLRQSAAFAERTVRSGIYTIKIPEAYKSTKRDIPYVLSMWIKTPESARSFTVRNGSGTVLATFLCKNLPNFSHYMFLSYPFLVKATSAGDENWTVTENGRTSAETEVYDVRITPLLSDMTVTLPMLRERNITGDLPASYPKNICLRDIKKMRLGTGNEERVISPEVIFPEDMFGWYFLNAMGNTYEDMCISDLEFYESYCSLPAVATSSASDAPYYSLSRYYIGSMTYAQSQVTDTLIYFEYVSRPYFSEAVENTLHYLDNGYVKRYFRCTNGDYNGNAVYAKEVFPGGKVCITENTYNSLGLPTKVKIRPNASDTPDNDVYTEETYTYTYADGLLSSHTDTAGKTVSYSCDGSLFDVRQIRMPDGTKCDLTKDPVTLDVTKATLTDAGGNKQEVNLAYTDGYNTETRQNNLRYLYRYTDGRMTKAMYGKTSTYRLKDITYNDTARTVETKDQDGGVIVDTYDIYGRLTKKTLGLSEILATVSYGGADYGAPDSYTAAEKVSGSSEATSSADTEAGKNVTYYYLNGLPEKVVSDGDDAKQTDTFGRDNASRIVTQGMNVVCKARETLSAHTHISLQSVSYEDDFSAEGRSSRISKVIHTVAEADEDSTELSGTKTLTTSLSYNDFGQISAVAKETATKKLTRNIVYETDGNKALGRVKSVTHKKDGNTSALFTETYIYDTAGRISDIKKGAKTVCSYTYDGFGRLVRENNSLFSHTITYDYDAYGNITSKKTYAYHEGTLRGEYTEDVFTYGDSNRPDRLTAVNGKTVTYENEPNKSTTHLSAFDGMTFTWSKGFLSGWYGVADTVTGEDHCTFRYNAQGQRIRKTYEYTPPSGSTDNYVKKCEDFMYYHTDGTLQLIVREVESTSGNRYRGHFRFLYGPDGVSGCIYNATETRTPVLYTYVRNALGDIVYICDENYNIKAEYVYDAYGNCQIKSDTTNGFARNNPFRYRGYFYDIETGFYYCQTRYYNPTWGRFISMDDVDYVDPQAVSGLNLYAYCNGDPVNFSDETGHFSLPNWAKWLIGGAVIAGLGIATIATGGAAAGVAGFIVASALKGAVIGAASGALVSGTVSGITSVASGNDFWSGFVDGAANGFMSGAVIGGITGAISGGVQVANAAKMWQPGTSPQTSTPFKTMKLHYKRHVVGEGFQKGNNVVKYTRDAVNFANRNVDVLNFYVPYDSGMQPCWTWTGGCKAGMNGQFTALGKILSFWYTSL